jgi:GNAT superfamily N-acetyltransferase
VNSASYQFSILDKTHNKASFLCGINLLDDYIRTQANQDKKKRVAVTYVLHEKDSNTIVGYYTLSSTAIELGEIPAMLQGKIPKYPNLPATLIARLALDRKSQEQGLGQYLLVDALQRAYSVSQQIASYAVIVETINGATERFYKKHGFLDLSNQSSQLFITMRDIEELFTI